MASRLLRFGRTNKSVSLAFHRFTSKTPAPAEPPISKPATRFSSRMYVGIVEAVGKWVPEKLQPFYRHPAGPTTIFFYAPFGKLALVVANIGDLYRPAEKLSFNQNFAIMLTGILYARWCTIITPKNWLLFWIQMGCIATGGYQVVRYLRFRYNLRYHPEEGEAEDDDDAMVAVSKTTSAKQDLMDYLPWIL